MNNNTKQGITDIMEQARSYLLSRYDDSFTPVRFAGRTWAYDYAVIVFSSAKYEKELEVSVKDVNGELFFSDTYYRLLFEKDAIEHFEGIAGGRFGVKVHFPDYLTSVNLEGIECFEDYLVEGKYIDVYFVTKTEFSEEDIQTVTDKLTEQQFTGMADFILVRDDLGDLGECSIRDIYGKYFVRRSQFIMDCGKVA